MANDPWKIFAAPFPFDHIEIKPQTVSRDNTKALAVAYFDARAAMARLDESFGPMGWSFETREIGKGIIGRLTVTVDGHSTFREDGSEYTDIEALKGAISGAFKRCFSAMGNRTLYEIDLGWQQIETYDAGRGPKFKSWTKDAITNMRRVYERQCQSLIVDHEKPAPEVNGSQPSPPAPATTPRPQPVTNEEKVAIDYLAKSLKLKSEQAKEYKVECAKFEVSWITYAREAEQKGVTTFDQLMKYLKEGISPEVDPFEDPQGTL